MKRSYVLVLRVLVVDSSKSGVWSAQSIAERVRKRDSFDLSPRGANYILNWLCSNGFVRRSNSWEVNYKTVFSASKNNIFDAESGDLWRDIRYTLLKRISDDDRVHFSDILKELGLSGDDDGD